MASLIKTKTRLSSARSTQKVIKAMELVASSKIKKARDKAVGVEFYFNTTMDAINKLFRYDEVNKMLNVKNAKDKMLIVSITSDMGLCGAYNANVTKVVNQLTSESNDSTNIVVGSKGIGKLEYEHKDILAKFTNLGHIEEYELAFQISDLIVEQHKLGNVSDIKVVYTKFINPILQEVSIIDLFDFENKVDNKNFHSQLLVEPNEEFVFEQLLTQYVQSIVYSAILNSFASEHANRRMSMEAANKNSLELIDGLNLELNRIRQSMITQEISEIIGGAEALNN
ncbi:MAG: ATP synthase F1 subunit gamma [Mycoplasmatales bacterium]